MIPEAVEERSDERFCVRLCHNCAKHNKANTRYQFSIAAGCDFGRPEAFNLEEPSLAERMLLADGNVYTLMCQFQEGLTRGSFTGHAISFWTDGEHRAN